MTLLICLGQSDYLPESLHTLNHMVQWCLLYRRHRLPLGLHHYA